MQAASKRAPHGGYADSRFFRARLVGLSVACPCSQGNPANCQFCRIRELPLAERYRWVASLNLVELGEMIVAHEQCLRITEQTCLRRPHRPPHPPPAPFQAIAESA